MKLTALNEQVTELQKQEKLLADTVQIKRRSEETASQNLNQARLAHDQAVRQAGWQQDQHKRLEGEIDRGLAQAAEITTEMADLDSEIEDTRSLLRERSAALAGLAVDEFQSQLAHWRTQSAVAERALADGRARLQERQTALERAGRRYSELESRIADLERSFESLGSEKGESRQSEAGIAAEIESLKRVDRSSRIGIGGIRGSAAGVTEV